MTWIASSAPVAPAPQEEVSAATPAQPVPQSPAQTTRWTHYSTTKFLALHAYNTRSSRWRVAAVLVATPVPALIGSVLPSLVPLGDPRLGIADNYTVLIHAALSTFLVAFGTILLTLGAASIPRQQYSERGACGVAAFTAAGYAGFKYLLASKWRFPVPFVVLTMTPIYGMLIAVAHIILLRNSFRRMPHLQLALKQYEKPSMLQLAQLVVYTGFTVAFERLTTLWQIAMVVLFPVVKSLLKRWLRKYADVFGEMSTEITVSTVEICASLYQSMILQTAPSTLAIVAIMGVDLVQGIFSIKCFMGRGMTTPHREVFPRALQILQRCQREGIDVASLSILDQKLPPEQIHVVREALQLAAAADKILLVEYFEVSVPIANTVFLLLTYRSSSTLYNTRLNRFHDNTELVLASTKSVLLYSLLQGISLLVFHIVLRWRHDMAALSHLAFVLEFHWRSIHGKLLVFFTLIFYFTLVHNGADFSLHFDYTDLMAGMALPPL